LESIRGTTMKNRTIMQATIVVVIIAVALLTGLSSLVVSAVVPASAPADEFSAERAMEHIRAIFSEPHPVGSQGPAQARSDIISQLEGFGLDPEVQQATALTPLGSTVNTSAVYNVVARRPGTKSSGAILLDADHDMMPMPNFDYGTVVVSTIEIP
jgi:hypothetical protein